MATIAHRRPRRQRRPVRLPAPAPRGPGASFSVLTWVGWVSLLAAAGWLLVAMRPVLDMGDLRSWSWGEVARLAWTGLSDAAVIALPAALEWGVPGARRRRPLLLLAAVLLALQVLARGAVILVQDWLFAANGFAFEADSPAVLGLGLLRLGTVGVGIAGAWTLSRGLAAAGARLDRRLLQASLVAGLILGTWFVPFYTIPTGGSGFFLVSPLFWLSVGGLILNAADTVLWCLVAVRLMAAYPVGLRPRRAWTLGAIAGGLIIGGRAFSMLTIFGGLEGGWVTVLGWALADGPWILLALAFAGGLGRGRVRRDDRPPRMRLFILHPTD